MEVSLTSFNIPKNFFYSNSTLLNLLFIFFINNFFDIFFKSIKSFKDNLNSNKCCLLLLNSSSLINCVDYKKLLIIVIITFVIVVFYKMVPMGFFENIYFLITVFNFNFKIAFWHIFEFVMIITYWYFITAVIFSP